MTAHYPTAADSGATMRLPADFREDPDSLTLRCPHRDLSVCDACAERPEILAVAGAHYWMPDPALRAEFAAAVAS